MSTFLQPAPQRAVPPGSLPSSKQKYLITLDFDAHVHLQLLINWLICVTLSGNPEELERDGEHQKTERHQSQSR